MVQRCKSLYRSTLLEYLRSVRLSYPAGRYRTGIKFGAGNGNAALKGVASIEDLGNHRVKITYNSKAGEVQNGMCFQSRPTVRDHAGTFFWKSKDIKMTSLDINSFMDLVW